MDFFQKAIERFDAENGRDPNAEIDGGVPHPRELLYARRLTEWVLRLAPGTSEALRLAARCQHICRWTIPREAYPITRAGYLRWRNDLKQFHASKSGAILREVGYGEEMIAKVRDLNLKKHFRRTPKAACWRTHSAWFSWNFSLPLWRAGQRRTSSSTPCGKAGRR